ncbi:MAG: hypothetical protein LC791_12555 [Acidobacteria bacterium]|nr:hypothetical protein [Acidobacteriota bacterium]
MNIQEIRAFKIDLLDEIHEMSQDPIPDIDAVKATVENLFVKLEASCGERDDTTAV